MRKHRSHRLKRINTDYDIRDTRYEGGFSLIEVLIAILLVGLAIASLVTANSAFTKANSAGTELSTAEFLIEQIRELKKHGIPYEVFPGVTAAFGAAARMGMEYTLPEITQTLILTRISGRTPVPETEDLEKLAAHKSSMAIYLSMAHVSRVEKILEKHYGYL